MANTYTYPSSDLHSVPDVYPVAYTNIHTLAGSHGRADIYSLPDLHAMAYVYTHTRSYRHGSAYADANGDRANTYRDPADGNAGAESDPGTDGEPVPGCAIRLSG